MQTGRMGEFYSKRRVVYSLLLIKLSLINLQFITYDRYCRRRQIHVYVKSEKNRRFKNSPTVNNSLIHIDEKWRKIFFNHDTYACTEEF